MESGQSDQGRDRWVKTQPTFLVQWKADKPATVGIRVRFPAMPDDITFLVSYPCPHCQATLESRAHRASAWLRCPRCGRASQPPASPLEIAPVATPAGELHVIGPAPEPKPMTPVNVVRPPAPATSSLRVFASAALFVSVMFLVFSSIERSFIGNAVFSALSVLFFVLLLTPPRPPLEATPPTRTARP